MGWPGSRDAFAWLAWLEWSRSRTAVGSGCLLVSLCLLVSAPAGAQCRAFYDVCVYAVAGKSQITVHGKTDDVFLPSTMYFNRTGGDHLVVRIWLSDGTRQFPHWEEIIDPSRYPTGRISLELPELPKHAAPPDKQYRPGTKLVLDVNAEVTAVGDQRPWNKPDEFEITWAK